MFGVLKRCSPHQSCEVPAGQFPQGFMPQVGGRWDHIESGFGCLGCGLQVRWAYLEFGLFFLTTGFQPDDILIKILYIYITIYLYI